MSDIRKTVLSKEARQAISSTNAAGDTITEKKSTQAKTLNSIPKNLRYDLENALVGLCDVWFEEIKPYLVRNNIKLHVHASDADGDREQSPASRECSHDVPGRPDQHRRARVSYAGSSSTRPTASRVPSRRPLASQFLTLTETPELIHSPRHNRKKETVRKPHKRRKCQDSQPKPLVPRLCRTYSIQPCIEPTYAVTDPLRKLQLFYNTTKFFPAKKKCSTLNASTQTERLANGKKRVRDKVISDNATKFAQCPSTATFLLPKQINRHIASPFFKDDLLDIITEEYDKKLKVIYTSPRTEDYPSIMNLFSPSEVQAKPKKYIKINKIPPWK